MSKVARAVSVIASVVATVAAFIPGGQPIAVIASAVSATAGGIAAATAKQRRPTALGAVNSVIIGNNMPIPYAVGRTFVAGAQVYDDSGGTFKSIPNAYRHSVRVLTGGGPIDSFEGFYADFSPVSFSAGVQGDAAGYYAGFLNNQVRYGNWPEDAHSNSTTAMPNWTGDHRMSGFASYRVSMLFDKDAQRYSGGVPQFGMVGKWVKVYDPRKDSTYPGGSGTHRWDDERTWEWSENGALHALTYARGRFIDVTYQGYPRVPPVKVLGCGFAKESIRISDFVEAANLAETNGWVCGGLIYDGPDISRWDNLKRFCETFAAQPVISGGMLGLKLFAPRPSLFTLTEADVIGTSDIRAMKPFQDRRNTVVYRYRSEANRWEHVQGDPVAVSTYVTEDGETRTEEVIYDLVQNKDQAAELATAKLIADRQLGPLTVTCKPRLMRFRPGEAGTVTLPEAGLTNRKMIITGRQVDPSGIVTLTLESEPTEADYAFALGQIGTAPPTPVIRTGQEVDDAVGDLTGSAGAGISSAQVVIYKRSATVPPLPTVDATYEFDSGELTGLNNGWTREPQAANGYAQYAAVATASGSASTDVIGPTEWSAPVVSTPVGPLLGSLSKSAAVVATDEAGAGGDYSAAGGTFKVSRDAVDLSASAAYSVVGTPTGGLSISINPTTGVYSVTGLTSDDGTAVLRATIGTDFVEQNYTIAKAKAGPAGTDGTDGTDGAPGAPGAPGSPGSPGTPGAPAKLIYLFSDRSQVNYDGAGNPTPLSQQTNFTISPQNLSSTTYTISLQRADNTVISAGSFLFALDGQTMTPSGNNVVMTGGTGTRFYISTADFPVACGASNGIIVTVSHADGVSDKMSVAKVSTGATGSTGSPGTPATSTRQITLYKRSSTGTPTGPTNNAVTYNFSTRVLGDPGNGWTVDPPAGTDPMYIVTGTVSSTTGTDTIDASEWSAPVIYTQGLNTAFINIYQRAATAPALPTNTATYQFSTKLFTTGPNNGWSPNIPAVNGQPLWVTQAAAQSATDTDTIPNTEWSNPPVIYVQDGASPGGNELFNSEFRFSAGNHDFGWEQSTANGTGGTITRTLNLAGFFGVLNVAYTQAVGTFTGSTTADGHRSSGGYEAALVDRLKQYGLKVSPGERLYCSMLQATQNCSGSPVIQFYNSAGTFLSDSTPNYSSATINGAIDGVPANFTRNGYFWDAPANAAYAALVTRIRPNAGTFAAGAPARLFYTQMYLTRVRAAETTVPPYTPGQPVESGADMTSAITGPVLSNYLMGWLGRVAGSGVTNPYQPVFRLRRGDTDLSSQATWSYTVLYGNFNTAQISIDPAITGEPAGVMSIGNTSMNSGWGGIRITAKIGGITRTRDLQLGKGFEKYTDTAFRKHELLTGGNITGTTVGTANVISPTVEVNAETGATTAAVGVGVIYHGNYTGQVAANSTITLIGQYWNGTGWVAMTAGTNSPAVGFSYGLNSFNEWVRNPGTATPAFTVAVSSLPILSGSTRYLRARVLAYISAGTSTSVSVMGRFTVTADATNGNLA